MDVNIGNKRPIEQSDLYELAYNDSSVGVYKAFSLYWKKEILNSRINNETILKDNHGDNI